MKAAVSFLWQLLLCHSVIARDLLPPPPFDEVIDNGTYGYYPTRKYATEPHVRAPETNFVQWSPECDDGLLYFLSPRGYSLPKPGPMILDRRGELVWAHHFENDFGGQAYDFMVQEFRGEPHLTFWLGDDQVRGHGAGFYHLLNSSYDIVHKIGGANGLSADLHEFTILPEGTALMTIYEVVPGDVSMLRTWDPENPEHEDPNWIWDCLFQEVDIESGELKFQWRASEFYQVNETYRGIGPWGMKRDPFDWFHINSMVKDELGNFLISARYTHSITYIDGKTQEIIWQLGGKRNHFMDLSGGNALNFAWQHDARFVDTNTFPSIYTPPQQKPGFTTKLISFFDNDSQDQDYRFGPDAARGMLVEVTYPTPGTEKAKQGPPERLQVDLNLPEDASWDERKIAQINGTDPAYTARLIKSYDNPGGFRSSSQGSMQLLPQNNGKDPKVLLGYGFNAAWTEFEADGTVLCDVHFSARTAFERGDVQSYRVLKYDWHGYPDWPPSALITKDYTEVLVSWNGATDVEEWVLEGSHNKTALDEDWISLERMPKHKFETNIPIPTTDVRYLRVVALAENSQILEHGISKALDRGIIVTHFGPSVTKTLPHAVVKISPFKGIFYIGCVLLFVFMIYEGYRKYLIWRSGRTSGPLMFPKAPYRLLAEA